MAVYSVLARGAGVASVTVGAGPLRHSAYELAQLARLTAYGVSSGSKYHCYATIYYLEQALAHEYAEFQTLLFYHATAVQRHRYSSCPRVAYLLTAQGSLDHVPFPAVTALSRPRLWLPPLGRPFRPRWNASSPPPD